MNETEYSELKSVALIKYKSFEKPDFQFVSDSIAEAPYVSIVEQLLHIVNVSEDTDPNDDVCFTYLLKDHKNTWVLQISMINLFGVLLRVIDDRNILVNTKNIEGVIEKQIIEILQENHIQLLDKVLLEIPINISLFNTEPDNTKVYQMLFSDVDFLPW